MNKLNKKDIQNKIYTFLNMANKGVGLQSALNANFSKAAKMIQTSSFNPSLIESNINWEIEKNKLKYKYPASISQAQIHRDASKFGYYKHRLGTKAKVCPYCNSYADKEEIPICYSTSVDDSDDEEERQEEFKLESSSALYFFFVKVLILYLFLHFLICDGFNLYRTYFTGEDCKNKTTQNCDPKLWNFASAVNQTSDDSTLFIQNILNLVMVVVSIIFFFLCRKKQYSIDKAIKRRNHKENEFTLLVSNIPTVDFPNKQDIKERNMKKGEEHFEVSSRIHLEEFFKQKIQDWLEHSDHWDASEGTVEHNLKQLMNKNGGHLRSDEIVKSISLCYDLTRLELLERNRSELIQKHHKGIEEGSDLGIQDHYESDRFSTIPKQVSFLNDCQIVLSKQFANDNSLLFSFTHFVGHAFISFQYQHYREYIFEQYQKNSKYLEYQGKKLSVEKASNPSDIYWKNMKYQLGDRLQKIVLSFVVLLLIMLLIFQLFVLLGHLDQKFELTDEIEKIKDFVLKIGIGFIPFLINFLIQKLALSLTRRQHHTTKSNETWQITIKLIVFQFITTALLYFFASLIMKHEFTSQRGLVIQILIITILTILLNIALGIIYPTAIWRSCNLFCSYRNLRKDDTVEKFQNELNEEYQYADFSMAIHYAYYMMIFFTVMFYAYLIPVLIPFAMVTFIIQYWVDKCNLFKRTRATHEFNFILSRRLLKVFQFSIVIYAIGTTFFIWQIHGSVNILTWIALIIAIIYGLFVCFGTAGLERLLFGKYETLDRQTYDDCLAEEKFDQTYWTTNPATYLVKEDEATGKVKLYNPFLSKILAEPEN